MRRLFLKLCMGVTAFPIVAAAQNSTTKQLSADELKKIIDEKKKFFFLDVREPKELEELGTLKGYVNIPVTQLETRYKEIPKDALVITA